jgi:hypothetical protein
MVAVIPKRHRQPPQQPQEESALKILKHSANQSKSMRILAKKGLRPLAYQEAFALSTELIKKLQGMWFFLAGRGIGGNGICTFDARGELVKSTGNETYDQKVLVRRGDMPLSLRVASDKNTEYYGRRFILNGGSTYDVAPVVVGIAGVEKIVDYERGAEVYDRSVDACSHDKSRNDAPMMVIKQDPVSGTAAASMDVVGGVVKVDPGQQNDPREPFRVRVGEAARKNITPELLANLRSRVAELGAAVEAGEAGNLNPEAAKPFRDLVRAFDEVHEADQTSRSQA